MPLDRQRKKQRKLNKNIYNTNTSNQILSTLYDQGISPQQMDIILSCSSRKESGSGVTNITISPISSLQQKPYTTKNKQKSLIRKKNREAKLYQQDVESTNRVE